MTLHPGAVWTAAGWRRARHHCSLACRDGVLYLQWQEVYTLSPPASLHVPLESDAPQCASTAEMAADAKVARFLLLPPICLASHPAPLSSSHSSPRTQLSHWNLQEQFGQAKFNAALESDRGCNPPSWLASRIRKKTTRRKRWGDR